MSRPLRSVFCFLLLIFSLGKIATADVFLRDESELYARDPALKQKFEQVLQAFYEQHQLPFYVITKTSVSYHSTVREEAARLRREIFTPEQEGFLLLYESDSGMFTLSSRPTISETHPEKWMPSKVPQHLDISLFDEWKHQIEATIDLEVVNGQSEKFDPQQACRTIAEAWIATISRYVEANQESTTLRWQPWAIVAGLMLVGFVSMHVIGKNANRKRISDNLSYEFPCPKVNIRLGAMNSGGGKLVSREFR